MSMLTYPDIDLSRVHVVQNLDDIVARSAARGDIVYSLDDEAVFVLMNDDGTERSSWLHMSDTEKLFVCAGCGKVKPFSQRAWFADSGRWLAEVGVRCA